ncbi:MAG TPA: 50S ribosomal protein L11 methyltransferase [Aggregatilineales bacterium]|nr:50S ribosomal protein L11 methyltransferase [Aggregatilineales bacterium]
MRWVEVRMDVDGEAAEAVADVLQRYGHQGVAIEQGGFNLETWEDEVPKADQMVIRAYFPDDDRAEATKRQLEDALGYLNMMYPMPTPEYSVVDEDDWAEAWKANYHPLRLGQHIFIRPRWVEVEPEPGDVVIALDPGMAFGTGTHPSTQLVLEAAENLLPTLPSAEVLDLGCGSGILAIGAVKMGAAHVFACDTDPIAVCSTLENAAANGVAGQMTVQEGSLELLLTTGYRCDLALVNILAKVIVMLCEQGLGNVVKPGGRAVFGGIIEEQADEVEAALRATGLIPSRRRRAGEWTVIEARRV